MCTNVIVKFLYEDLLMPDDTFRVGTRKRVIAVSPAKRTKATEKETEVAPARKKKR